MAKGTNGGSVSLEEAQAQMQQAQAALETAREASLASAQARLAELDEERETLIAQIRSLGGRRRSRGSRSRASNEVTLLQAVATVLSNSKKPLSPTEVAEAVKKAGYKTNSENYPTMVAQSLSKLAGLRMNKSPVAIRPERGQYSAGSGMARYLANPENATVAEGE